MLMTRMLFTHLKKNAYLRRIFSRLGLFRCRYGLDRSGAGRRSHGMDSLFSIFLCQMALLKGNKKNVIGGDHMLFFKFIAILISFHPSLGMFCRGVLYLREVGYFFPPCYNYLKVPYVPKAADRPHRKISATKSSPPDVGFPKALHLYFSISTLLTSTLLRYLLASHFSNHVDSVEFCFIDFA